LRTPIRPIGAYLPLDAEGYVINDTSLDHLSSQYRRALDAIIEAYLAHSASLLLGVYLRGSLAAGSAVEGQSDIDVFALLARGDSPCIRWQELPHIDELVRARHPSVRRVDAHLATYEEPFTEHNPRLAMVLATQSICIHGIDLVPRIGKRYRPGPDMILHARWVGPDIAALEQFEARAPSSELVRERCREIMKILIRAGFELVMEREGRYTQSLYLCWASFAAHYPDKADEMKEALQLFLDPPGDLAEWAPLARRLGYFLVAEIDARLRLPG